MSKYFKKTLVIFLSSILLLLIVAVSILWGFSNDLPDLPDNVIQVRDEQKFEWFDGKFKIL